MFKDLNLARGTINRDELTRNNPSALAKARNSPDARFILVAEQTVAIDPDAPGRVLTLSREQAAEWGSRSAVYLGKDAGHCYFACDATGLVSEQDVQAHDHPTMRPIRYWAHEWEDLDTALAVSGAAVLQWRRSAKFCTKCGLELAVAPSGWELICSNNHMHFPRTDPAVIMAIHDSQNRLLLGRNSAWGPGKYSVLAGFVEAGESLEAAVRREVFEEAHVKVGDLRYFGSQPWPFPRSLMLAFDGWTDADASDIAVDGKEMADARFFTREELADALRTQHIQLPSPTSVAASLIQSWLGESFEDVLKR